MKNYELITKLEKLPAGAEVSFDCICEQNEVSKDGGCFIVSKEICNIEYDNERIMLC